MSIASSWYFWPLALVNSYADTDLSLNLLKHLALIEFRGVICIFVAQARTTSVVWLVVTKPRQSTTFPPASLTEAAPSASRERSPKTSVDTSRTGGRLPTATPTWWLRSSWRLAASMSKQPGSTPSWRETTKSSEYFFHKKPLVSRTLTISLLFINICQKSVGS